MLYRELLDHQAAPPTILNFGAKSPLTKVFVQLAPFLDQTTPIFTQLANFWRMLKVPPINTQA